MSISVSKKIDRIKSTQYLVLTISAILTKSRPLCYNYSIVIYTKGRKVKHLTDITEKVEIIRSSRKTLSIQISPDGRVIARAPQRMPQKEIFGFIQSKSGWIEKHLKSMENNSKATPLTAEELNELADRALEYIPERVRFYAPLVGVSYGGITIRNQKTRWGSCSSKGNLNFNCLLMLAPPEVIDSIVVHELCHRKEMNHSPRFYAEVLRVYPEYYKWNDWLKKNGATLLARMPK
ncbi:MAG: M48 family metallopeptidase [Ruminococcus sp.]|nr:M48 family metallopeptidase [Ruminococcus sp.]